MTFANPKIEKIIPLVSRSRPNSLGVAILSLTQCNVFSKRLFTILHHQTLKKTTPKASITLGEGEQVLEILKSKFQ
jgi:hypothetical protein